MSDPLLGGYELGSLPVLDPMQVVPRNELPTETP